MASSYPNFPGKHELTAYVSPKDTIEYVRKHGDLEGYNQLKGVLFTYQSSVFEYLCHSEGFGASPPRGFRGIVTLPSTNHEIGVLSGVGFGAPIASVLLENFVALGTTQYLSIGTAGGLSPGCQAGDTVLCDRAIRDEGVSHHYLPSAKFAEPSEALTSRFHCELELADVAFTRGCSWTIDTPYRESVDETRQYQQEGVLCVEMEAAALFSVAQFRSVEIASAFVISDLLDSEEWDPQMKHEATTSSLNRLYDVALRTLI
jgi:uridine phosphorylase